MLEAVDQLLLGGSVAEAAALAEELTTFADGARRDHVLARLAAARGHRADADGLPGRAREHGGRGRERDLAATIAERRGGSPARRKIGPRARLTSQELAVARLVAAGLTNRQAAAELVVSVKTIEYHLGNAYAKLNVTSRTQLALALRPD